MPLGTAEVPASLGPELRGSEKVSPYTGHSVPPCSPHHSDSFHIQYIAGNRKSLVREAPSLKSLRRQSITSAVDFHV